jgi:DNA primase
MLDQLGRQAPHSKQPWSGARPDGGPQPRAGRVDTAALRHSHPIADVVARYGVDLRPAGRALVGRCPLHDDGGRPNLHVYTESESWYCYRCSVGGDVIRFIEEVERVDFLTAVARLARTDARAPTSAPVPAPSAGEPRRGGAGRAADDATRAAPLRGAAQACLAAAVELYGNRLLSDSQALAYLEGRGLNRETAERYRLGYAAGDELVEYLRWRGLPLEAARDAGLVTREGREFFAGRVVVPEVRSGEPIWAVGRAIDPHDAGPKYLGMRGHKPLLGWEGAAATRTVCLVEGVFDWLVLCAWGTPGLALVGTHASADMLASLGRFARIYVCLDNDEAGRAATTDLLDALGPRAVPVALPRLPGVKDVADLALRADGRALFARCVTAAARVDHTRHRAVRAAA